MSILAKIIPNEMTDRLLEIENVLVDKQILTEKFSCDLSACKGACCTMKSDFGAPIIEDEIDKIEQNLENVYKYLPEKNIREIRSNRFWESKQNELMLKSINKKDCVFVYYDDDIAKCAIEKAYHAGESNFRKPISCHLFPIRVGDFGGDVLRYEKYDECSDAMELGKKKNVSIAEFCQEALERTYSSEWFNKLKSYTG